MTRVIGDEQLSVERRAAQLEKRVAAVERPAPDSISFSDGNRVRVRIGHDGAVYGVRVWDSSGNLVNDATSWPVGTLFSYNELRSTVSVTGTAGAQNTVLTTAAVTLDGATSVSVTFRVAEVDTAAVAGALVAVTLWDGSTELGQIAVIQTPAAAVLSMPVNVETILPSPSAGVHTYTVKAWKNLGNGAVVASTGGVTVPMPGFLAVRKA